MQWPEVSHWSRKLRLICLALWSSQLFILSHHRIGWLWLLLERQTHHDQLTLETECHGQIPHNSFKKKKKKRHQLLKAFSGARIEFSFLYYAQSPTKAVPSCQSFHNEQAKCSIVFLWRRGITFLYDPQFRSAYHPKHDIWLPLLCYFV